MSDTYGPNKPTSEYLTLWDYLELNELQEEALLTYMRDHCVTVEQAITRLATEGLAIDSMCPEISEPEPCFSIHDIPRPVFGQGVQSREESEARINAALNDPQGEPDTSNWCRCAIVGYNQPHPPGPNCPEISDPGLCGAKVVWDDGTEPVCDKPAGHEGNHASGGGCDDTYMWTDLHAGRLLVWATRCNCVIHPEEHPLGVDCQGYINQT